MRVKVEKVADGPGPRETVVAIETINGREEVIVDRDQVTAQGLDIGFVILAQRDKSLVELPRETLTGRWRVWVSSEAVSKGP
jgi:hypothetical protein